ncbi:ATP-dependent helicase [Pedobacter panaciterrae]|uniref:ATP-dependent helicase n=1 Tax=Pedobacter panaciterrae TaxID=363849 RepID=UPI00155DC2E7|nr:ATP-dependent DNA helicase [Pedobacter panaciterrae]NQX56862.1 ATP-dependent helicase [Pedobacter panaciterrae]
MSINQILKAELTEEQYKAVIDNNKEILCLACAGSGKSRTLAYRIARLIAEGASAESIVAFTFTEKAAESIKRRVAEALEKCGFSPILVGAMSIGTIHSYCQHLLGEMDPKYRQFDVLDENRLKLFILSRYPKLSVQDVRASKNLGMFATINEVSNCWKIANDEMISFEDLDVHDPYIADTLKKLYSLLDKDQYIDFSLMIRLVVEALEAKDRSVGLALQNVKHLLVDEYQDVNPSQEKLIKGIYNLIETLIVVGDDDQSIYAWRGADVNNIIEFSVRYPNSSIHTLSENFRSTRAIVETADNFITNILSTTRISKSPISHSDGNVRHLGNLWFDNPIEEAEWIAGRIKDLLGTKYVENGSERGLTKADFAILMRSVSGGTRNGDPARHSVYTQALTNANISYSIEAEGSIFTRPYGTVLRGTMELLREPGVTREELKKFFDEEIILHFPHANFRELAKIIGNWNTKIHTPMGGARRKVYPQELIHELLNAFGVHKTKFDDHVLRDLGVFSSIILDVEKVFVSIDDSWRFTSVLNFLQNVAETGYDVTQIDLFSKPDSVTISTVHKMKGLEFPVVFIVDVVQQRFPVSNSQYRGFLPHSVIQEALDKRLYSTDIYGEARLFYTALTRAERILYVTGSENHPGLKRPKKQSEFKLRLNHSEITVDATSLPNGLEKIAEKRRIDDNSMPTSFTEIKDYLECPMKYKYRKIFGFSPAVPELFGFGLTTHAAINKLHKQFSNSKPTKDDGIQAVEDIFHLKHVFASNDPERKGPFENAKAKSKEIVGNYAKDYPDDFVQMRQLEQSFEIKAGNAVITGAIDLLLKEDVNGAILEAKVIDFKSMDHPKDPDPYFWINLSLQVQLYAYASKIVLNENAKTGSVHLLKANQRIDIPIDDMDIESAVENIRWAVDRILNQDFPFRPSFSKCGDCDFKLICPKIASDFSVKEMPSPISIPGPNGNESIMVAAFSDYEEAQF